MFSTSSVSRCGKRVHSEAFSAETGELYGYCVHCKGSVKLRAQNPEFSARMVRGTLHTGAFVFAILCVLVSVLPLVLWIAP